jgi:hypothetical protein
MLHLDKDGISHNWGSLDPPFFCILRIIKGEYFEPQLTNGYPFFDERLMYI